jgi:hypothetical protein
MATEPLGWSRLLEREKYDYHQKVFQKENPELHNQRLNEIAEKVALYKQTMEEVWNLRSNGNKKRELF